MQRALAGLAIGLGCAIGSAGAQRIEPPAHSIVRWMQIFASPGDDWINDIAPLENGDFVASGFLNRAGLTNDWRALAVRFGASGELRWRREYGEGEGVDALWAAVEGPRRELVFAGFTGRQTASGLDAWILRASADGAAISETAVGDSQYDRVTDDQKEPASRSMASVAPWRRWIVGSAIDARQSPIGLDPLASVDRSAIHDGDDGGRYCGGSF